MQYSERLADRAEVPARAAGVSGTKRCWTVIQETTLVALAIATGCALPPLEVDESAVGGSGTGGRTHRGGSDDNDGGTSAGAPDAGSENGGEGEGGAAAVDVCARGCRALQQCDLCILDADENCLTLARCTSNCRTNALSYRYACLAEVPDCDQDQFDVCMNAQADPLPQGDCGDCILAECALEAGACQANAPCNSLVRCWAPCVGTGCLQDCADDAGTTVTAEPAVSLFSCARRSCSAACESEPSGSGGGAGIGGEGGAGQAGSGQAGSSVAGEGAGGASQGGSGQGGLSAGGTTAGQGGIAEGGSISQGGAAVGGAPQGGADSGFTVLDGGYVQSGPWHGYAWTMADSLGTAVSPLDFSAILAGESLCVEGRLTDSDDAFVLLGVNVAQLEGTDTEAGFVSPMGDGISITVADFWGMPLRVQIDGGSETARWCADIPGSGGVVPFSAFNTRCWDGLGTNYAGEDFTNIAVALAGTDGAVINYSFCLEGLEPGTAPVCANEPTLPADATCDGWLASVGRANQACGCPEPTDPLVLEDCTDSWDVAALGGCEDHFRRYLACWTDDEVCGRTECLAGGTTGVTCETPDAVYATPIDCYEEYQAFYRCAAMVPEAWVCSALFYGSGDGCDCGCGTWDPDCDDTALTLYNCDEDEGEVCVSPGVCAAPGES